MFDGTERIELNSRGIAYVAGEIGRYSLLNTDTDAKGMAYEAITSHTLKQRRGQFFTPRNVIRMMVEMVDPKPRQVGARPGLRERRVPGGRPRPRPTPVSRGGRRPSRSSGPRRAEVGRRAEPREYARTCLYGIDVDSDLRKAARMNMVMNNDGHGNILCFNSLEYGVENRRTPEMGQFEARGGGHGASTTCSRTRRLAPRSRSRICRPERIRPWPYLESGGRDVAAGAPQKKVSPEILFIEACYKFLKPGTGVMAIVLPNGILGNPGRADGGRPLVDALQDGTAWRASISPLKHSCLKSRSRQVASSSADETTASFGYWAMKLRSSVLSLWRSPRLVGTVVEGRLATCEARTARN